MLLLNFHPFPIIETERLILRQEDERDVASFFRLRSDADMVRHSGRKPMETEAEVFPFLQMIKGDMAEGKTVSWGITQKGSDEHIGNISYWRILPEHGYAEMGYMLWKTHWRKGIMEEAIRAVLKYGFETMNLHRVEANTDPENASSRLLLEKIGFRLEGLYKENYRCWDGRFTGTAAYGLLKSDW
jgi:[ribosomal protein S5]-alanine N-acetyltransferase